MESLSLMDEVREALGYIMLSQSELQSNAMVHSDSQSEHSPSISFDLPACQYIAFTAEHDHHKPTDAMSDLAGEEHIIHTLSSAVSQESFFKRE